MPASMQRSRSSSMTFAVSATIAKRAHALKGSSANIWAGPLSVAAANLEKAAHNHAQHEIADLVKAVSAKLYEVGTQLRSVA